MKEKKIVGILLGFIIFSELIIFFSAYWISGEKRWIQVISGSGDLVYEVKGNRLPSFDKYYFENNFGKLENYNIKLVEKRVPFPVRGWLFASIALPVGFLLITALFINALSGLFPSLKNKIGISGSGWLKFVFLKKNRDGVSLNIYYISGFILLLSFLLWALPILFNSAFERVLYVITKYPAIFLILFTFLFIFILYISFLRFRLKKYEIDRKYNLELKRLEKGSFLIEDSGKENDTAYLPDNRKNIPDYNGDKDS